MNIPDEVMAEAFGGSYFYMPYFELHKETARVIAEWARKEALREAADVVETHHRESDGIFWAEREIRALAKEDKA